MEQVVAWLSATELAPLRLVCKQWLQIVEREQALRQAKVCKRIGYFTKQCTQKRPKKRKEDYQLTGGRFKNTVDGRWVASVPHRQTSLELFFNLGRLKALRFCIDGRTHQTLTKETGLQYRHRKEQLKLELKELIVNLGKQSGAERRTSMSNRALLILDELDDKPQTYNCTTDVFWNCSKSPNFQMPCCSHGHRLTRLCSVLANDAIQYLTRGQADIIVAGIYWRIRLNRFRT
jgi:hypothetical protein